MNTNNPHQIRTRHFLALACMAALGTAPAMAQDNAASSKNAKKLESIIVTGSLIPQTQIETATPVTTITAEQLKARGFATVADALQQSSFATGSVQGAGGGASFTKGAQTLSFFGLPPGFVKYLIDGRPMGNFPALYNGSDAFNNLSSIPAEMVDHIDILPGGQSSLYGSDAIAGVINIILKKRIDAPVIDARYGWLSDGGGIDRRVYLADSFSWGKFNIIGGVQVEKTQPIWGYDRDLTKQYYTEGTGPAVAGRDYLVNSTTKVSNSYVSHSLLDRNNCSNVTSQFQNTEGAQWRKNSGNYCGSFYSPGYRTLQNDKNTANAYTHATFDATDNLQLYGDFLYNYSAQKMSNGSGYTWWGTQRDYGAFYDPSLKDYVNLQRAFTPEEVGGYGSIMDKQYENSYMLTLGGKGTFGQSSWDYDAAFTHSDDHLIERDFQRWSDAIDGYFQSHVLGANLGLSPRGFDTYAPNYAAFYRPISTADFRSFTGYTDSYSKTWDNMLRGQVTNSSLFTLPGGNAGIAMVLEGGNQGWDYSPDPRLIAGDAWGATAVQGAGHRSRYAATTEMNMPLFKQLTVDLSARYDDYKVASQDVGHGTYNIGLEYRPFDSLLLRGKYGTAFKVPTLPDEFQGPSGYYSSVTDYYNCAKLGYMGSNIGDCPNKYGNVSFAGQQSGSTSLKPITATVWNYGVVWAPINNLSVSVDYYHYNINNEVSQQSADLLSVEEFLCRGGALDINSPSCKQALSQIVRNPSTSKQFLGDIKTIYTPKVNVSNEQVNALVANFNYLQDVGRFGKLAFNASYSDILRHDQQQYPGDPTIDLLRSPYFSSDFKTKINSSVTWSMGKWSSTFFVNRYGSTPNYLASAFNNYTAPGTGRLAPWFLYNASVTYSPLDNLAVSFLVNNLFNNMPPQDHSYPGTTGTPYNAENFNVYGRALYLEATYKFAKGK